MILLSTTIYFSSNPIGEVTDRQLQAVLDRYNLGTLISTDKTHHGIGNQTLFIRSSTGEYVLKGNPLFDTQFIEERYFVHNLRCRTELPVPDPYEVDETQHILAFSYAVMPRLPGIHLSGTEAGLEWDEKKKIADRYAEGLLQLHSWKTTVFGEFAPDKPGNIRLFAGGYPAWLYARIRYWLKDAAKYSEITEADAIWVEHVLQASATAFLQLQTPCFVMGDYKTDNILMERTPDGWRLNGIFDFTMGYFGDGIADLPRMAAMYLEQGEQELAEHLILAYYNGSDEREGFVDRFRVHMLHQRVLDWGCAKATNSVTWDPQLSFTDWASPFTEAATRLFYP